MKKLSSLIAAILSALLFCTVGFAANAEGPDAYTVYKYAMKKLDEAATIKTTASYVFDDDNVADVITTQTQSAGKSLKMEAHMYDEYEDAVLHVYYKDGYYYQRIVDDEPNVKRKTKMSEEKAIAECFGIDRSLKRSAFEDAMLQKTGSGYTLKYRVLDKNFGGIIANAMSALYNGEDSQFRVKNSPVTYILDIGKDGTLKSYRISFASNFYEDGYDELDILNRISCTVKTYGDAQMINYPGNLDVYREIEL